MDDVSHVPFGRRGVDLDHIPVPNGHAAHATEHATSGTVPSYRVHYATPPMPSVIVNRSMTKMAMMLAAFFMIVLLTAGSSKHSAALPYWMRHDGQSHVADYAFALAIDFGIALVLLLPMLRRPVVLQLFDDHFEYLGLFGAPRVVRWADVDEVSKSVWTKYIRVKLTDGTRIGIYKHGLDRSAGEVIDLLESGRSRASNRRMQIPSREIAAEYLFPGH